MLADHSYGDSIRVHVEVRGNRLDYRYEVVGAWRKFFRLENNFFVEYSEDVSKTPPSIAIIPMLCNVLPMAWVCDAEIIVDELDRDFYEHLDEIKRGYVEMMPRVKFGGKLTVGSVVDNSYEPTERAVLLFSGGVDATTSLITHADESLTLMTIHGSDIALDDLGGWKKVHEHVSVVGKEFGCETLFIRSSFRMFLDEGALTSFVKPYIADGWWHDLQHGIGLLGHAAPYTFLHRLKTIYIASTYTARDKKICASAPTIDNYLAVASCRTIHDGYELSRQDKVHRIIEYQRQTGRSIRLRVCWRSRGGSNCCRCEKCWRTILEFYAERAEPREFGFDYDDWKELVRSMKNNRQAFEARWRDVYYVPTAELMRTNYRREEIPSELLWFYDMDFKF